MNDASWPAATADDHLYTGPRRARWRGDTWGDSTSYPPGLRGHLDSPFFRSKFKIPNHPRHFVERARLLTLLDNLAEYPVTAIVAPAGAGKTALAADWVRHEHRPCGWLSLDEADRDPVQFWRSVTAALESLGDGFLAEHEVPRVQPLTPPDTAAPDHNGPDAAGTTATLVLDDLDRLDEDERFSAALESLVRDRPPTLRLLLLSRHRLPLPVDRLRAAGELADIHFDQLRFSAEEASLLLGSLCPELSAATISVIVERAVGWTAALQLTALSIRSGHSATAPPRVPPEGGPDQLIDEYLWQEVLRKERPELIRMLLATAVVARVNYGLAEILTGRPDAGDLLEEAEDRGLFVTRLDDSGWFQVHSLVRDMLLAKYERRWPMGLREQHARAARWFESMDDHFAALEHWHRAERPDDVLRSLAEVALDWGDSGRSHEVARVIDQISPQAAGSGPDSLVRYAWCALMAGRTRFEDALAAAELGAGEPDVDADADGPVATRLALLRAAAASLSGDWDRCELLARPALACLGEQASNDPIARFGWTLVALSVALSERWHDGDELVRQVRVAESRDPAQRLAFESARVLGLAVAGHPLDAMHAAIRLAPLAEDLQRPMLLTELSLAEAIVAAEVGDRGRARSVLLEIAGRTTHPVSSLQLVATLALVQLCVVEGQLEDALAAFSGAELLFEQQLRPTASGPRYTTATAPESWLLSSLSRAGATLSLATGDLDAAAQWSRRVADPFWGPVGEAKVFLARGDHGQATDALIQAKPRCVRHEVVHQLVLARSTAARDHESAAESVAAAVQSAADHGMLQTVAAEGTEVLDLVELAAWRVPETWMQRLRHILVPTWQVRPTGPIEPLTERERDVLRLLPSRLTLREISSHLNVTQNTLKFHLRAIYRKLGVDSRATAVDVARQLRLLPGG